MNRDLLFCLSGIIMGVSVQNGPRSIVAILKDFCYIPYASYLKYLLYHTNYQCVCGGRPSFSSSILSCCKIPNTAKDHFSRIEKLALGFTGRANLALKISPE